MARGKAKSIDEKLEEVRAAIGKAEEKVDALKEQEAALLQEKKNAEVNALYRWMQDKGLTIEQVMDMTAG